MHRFNYSGDTEASSTDSWHLPVQHHNAYPYPRELAQPLPPVSTILSSKPGWYTDDEALTSHSTPQSATYPYWRSSSSSTGSSPSTDARNLSLTPLQEQVSKDTYQPNDLQRFQSSINNNIYHQVNQQNMVQAICLPYNTFSQFASLPQNAAFSQHLYNNAYYNPQAQYVQLVALVGMPDSNQMQGNIVTPRIYSPEKKLGGGISKPSPARFKSPNRNNDGKFPCPHCEKVYTNQKHWRRHNLRHTGERPYSCRLCSETFSRSDVLKRHVQKCSERHEKKQRIEHVIHA